MSIQRTVLVVDDDEQLLRLIARLLEGAGHRVHTARDLPETLSRLAELVPAASSSGQPVVDLVLLDVNLAPGGGAAEILPRLRAQWPGLEVVLMSGDALPASLEQELAATGGRFLRKPFSPKALLRLLDESTGSSPAAGSSASRMPER